MKLTESKLKQIIREELQKVLVTEVRDGLPELDFERDAKTRSAMGELHSPKKLMKAVSLAMRAIIDAADVKSTTDFIRKYDKQHPLRKEFRQLFGLRKALRRGKKVDMAALLNKLEADSVLAAALDLEPTAKGFDVPKGKPKPGENPLNKMLARIRKNVEQKKLASKPAGTEVTPTPAR